MVSIVMRRGVVVERVRRYGREPLGGRGRGESSGAAVREQRRRRRDSVRVRRCGSLAAQEARARTGDAGDDREAHGCALHRVPARVRDARLQRLGVPAVHARFLRGGALDGDRRRQSARGVGQVQANGPVVGLGVDAVAARGVVCSEGGRSRRSLGIGSDDRDSGAGRGEDPARASAGRDEVDADAGEVPGQRAAVGVRERDLEISRELASQLCGLAAAACEHQCVRRVRRRARAPRRRGRPGSGREAGRRPRATSTIVVRMNIVNLFPRARRRRRSARRAG